VNFFSGVPAIFSSLLQVPIDDCDVSSLDYALCGAAPMPVETFDSFQRLTGVRILEGYGRRQSALRPGAHRLDRLAPAVPGSAHRAP
jgi:fatty-acyl-CoA synthase